jgi:dephospho-CoA kinase
MKGASMVVFVVVGMPASGKNIARGYAGNAGIPYFATGDIVRAEVARRGLPGNASNTARVSDELRGADGLGVTRKAFETAQASGADVVFMEGIRSWQEIDLLKEKAACVVIAFVAPRLLRKERIMARGRTDDSPTAFDERERRELSYGTAVPIVLADEYILNTKGMDEAREALEAIVLKYRKQDGQ